MKRLICFVTVVAITLTIGVVPVSAHTDKSTIKHQPQYTHWDIFEPPDNSSLSAWTCHSASNDISVGYGDLSVLSSSKQDTFKGYIDYAIERWAGCSFGANINMYYSDNPTVTINAYSDSSDSTWGYNDFVNASVVDAGTGGKHFTHLDIYVNVSSSKVSVTNSTRCKHVLAHELGHAIGLADLTTDTSDNSYSSYLMGRNNYTITSPTLAEVKGAGVILGMHTSHLFSSYEYYNSTYHRTICSRCDGYKFEKHNKANGICTECGS